jgi:dTDP-4-amino-4,6-dideoxygalactose transaminase
MQFRMGNTENPDVVVKLTSTTIIPALTAALSSALLNSGVAGSWGTAYQAVLAYYKSKGHNLLITQSNTFYGAIQVARNMGFSIAYVPCDETDLWNMDSRILGQVLKDFRNHSPIVCLAHIGGWANKDYRMIAKICDMYQAPLIEDCAHAFGVTYPVPVGTLGDVGIFSFYATKSINAGEGGAIVTKDKELYNFVLRYRTYDRANHHKILKDDTLIQMQGNNIRISEYQAIVLCASLNHWDKFVKYRQGIVNSHYSFFQMQNGFIPLENMVIPGFTNFYKYPIKKSIENENSKMSGPCFDYTCPLIDIKMSLGFVGREFIPRFLIEQDKKSKEFQYLSTL